MMEKEDGNQREFKLSETDLFLQWGNRKRVRCVRVRDPNHTSEQSSSVPRVRRKITSGFVTFSSYKETSPFQSSSRFITRNSETATLRSENRKSSPEKDERFYTTRGSLVGLEENGKVSIDGGTDRRGDDNRGGFVWPKLFVTLSSKEKEEDFMAMKGCKLPQRPKKRAKIIQRTLLLVSPGAWLTDMCQERYEVREKKNSRKRPRGLKAMGNMDSDSES